MSEQIGADQVLCKTCPTHKAIDCFEVRFSCCEQIIANGYTCIFCGHFEESQEGFEAHLQFQHGGKVA